MVTALTHRNGNGGSSCVKIQKRGKNAVKVLGDYSRVVFELAVVADDEVGVVVIQLDEVFAPDLTR